MNYLWYINIYRSQVYTLISYFLWKVQSISTEALLFDWLAMASVHCTIGVLINLNLTTWFEKSTQISGSINQSVQLILSHRIKRFISGQSHGCIMYCIFYLTKCDECANVHDLWHLRFILVRFTDWLKLRRLSSDFIPYNLSYFIYELFTL